MVSKLRRVEAAINQSQNYDEWKMLAQEHDELSGRGRWKAQPSRLFDHDLIALRRSELRDNRINGRVDQLVFHLHEGLHGNLGNIANSGLYNRAMYGTKDSIVEYLQEVKDCLLFLKNTSNSSFDLQAKLHFFRETGQAFGRSALMLSGGATLGLFHLGVVKSLFDEGLLPQIISGSSAGAVVGAILGTHNDQELLDMFTPEYLEKKAFKWSGLKATLRGHSLMDGEFLECRIAASVPDITFEEGYERSGRLINITVSPYDHHQESRLLNMRTSPNVLVRKASLASCAIPGVFPPVALWAKNINGDQVPYIPSRKWVDGSIRDDLPILRLSRLYGVNHSIVSQTNPHVVPFISRSDDQTSLPSFVREVVNKNVLTNVNYMLEAVRKYTPSNNVGLVLDKVQSVVRQKYSGDINISPPPGSFRLHRTMANPGIDEINEFIRTGQLATWPRIEMIRNTTLISRTFSECLRDLEELECRELTKLAP